VTRGEAVGLVVSSFAVLLAASLSALGWWLNRRTAAHIDLLTRVAKLEEKASLMDVGGTHGNRVAIDQLRRELDALESLHRRDVAEIGERISSNGLSIGQLAERLNGWVWREGRPAERRRESGGS
jgi:hypothetical protein